METISSMAYRFSLTRPFCKESIDCLYDENYPTVGVLLRSIHVLIEFEMTANPRYFDPTALHYKL